MLVRFNTACTAGVTAKQPLQHGRKSRGDAGDESPPEFGVRGTLVQIVPPEFVMFQNMKHQLLTYNAV